MIQAQDEPITHTVKAIGVDKSDSRLIGVKWHAEQHVFKALVVHKAVCHLPKWSKKTTARVRGLNEGVC